MMRLFGGKPVFWSNLPCAIEPPARAVGCAAVNAALAAAPSRWPNLTVIDWATEASSHPDYIVAQGPFRVLYTSKGHRAWATIVAEVLDAAFPAPLAARVSAATAVGVPGGPPVITFVGDSNIAVGSTMNALAFTARDVPYTIVNLAKPSSTIRYADCPDGSCSTFDFWQTRLADGAAKVASDAYVVNLGINDTVVVGSAGGPGYAAYGGEGRLDDALVRGEAGVLVEPAVRDRASGARGGLRGGERGARGRAESVAQSDRHRLGDRGELAPGVPLLGTRIGRGPLQRGRRPRVGERGSWCSRRGVPHGKLIAFSLSAEVRASGTPGSTRSRSDPIRFAITSFMISSVPPPMRCRRASRNARGMPVSSR